MSKKILIISGDPNSINSEIIFKCWKKIKSPIKKNIYLISNIRLLKNQFGKLKYNIPMKKVDNIKATCKKNLLKVIDVDLKFKDPFNINIKERSKFVIKSIDLAHNIAIKNNNNIAGIINCAIDKRLLSNRGIGVTEYLARKSNIKKGAEVMLIANKELSVSPLTTHVDLKDVNKNIVNSSIVKKIKIIDIWFKKNLNIKPKIAVLGLNPHNAELRKNSEEKKIISPAIKKLKKKGLKIYGPLAADSTFIEHYKKYNVIVGMYHDQVLTPFKALYKFNAINLTLGLKYLRTSPDHGTAVDIIKKKIANETSLLNCINFIYKLKK